MILPDINLLIYAYNLTAPNDVDFSRCTGLRWKIR